MKFARAIAAVLVALAGKPASGQAEWQTPLQAWEGVWQGTIGTLPIHICLDTTPSRLTGAYYYDRYRSLIRLELGDDKQSWVENDPDDRASARWQIAAKGNDELAGFWIGDEKKLPVRLRRIGSASAKFDGPCGSDAFHSPRVRETALAKRNLIKDGVTLTAWTFKPDPPFKSVEVSTFTINRPDAAAARINALLRAVLPEADGGDWLDCMSSTANAQFTDGDFFEIIEPRLVTARWLAATHNSDNYCGGAHPNNSVVYRTFDLEQGVEVDPLDWFSPRAVRSEGVGQDHLKTLTVAFRQDLLAGYRPTDSECDGVFMDQAYWSVGVVRGALVFQPQLPRVVLACGEDIAIPFTRLQPWLNPRGKAVVASLPR